MKKKTIPDEESVSPYEETRLAKERLFKYMQKGIGIKPINNSVWAAIVEANGGCVVGGKRDKDGNIIIDAEVKSRLRG